MWWFVAMAWADCDAPVKQLVGSPSAELQVEAGVGLLAAADYAQVDPTTCTSTVLPGGAGWLAALSVDRIVRGDGDVVISDHAGVEEARLPGAGVIGLELSGDRAALYVYDGAARTDLYAAPGWALEASLPFGGRGSALSHERLVALSALTARTAVRQPDGTWPEVAAVPARQLAAHRDTLATIEDGGERVIYAWSGAWTEVLRLPADGRTWVDVSAWGNTVTFAASAWDQSWVPAEAETFVRAQGAWSLGSTDLFPRNGVDIAVGGGRVWGLAYYDGDSGGSSSTLGIFDLPEVDQDGDGATSRTDCDDDDPTSFPGAPELADGVDHDCDERLVTVATPTDTGDTGAPTDTGAPVDTAPPTDTAAPVDTDPPDTGSPAADPPAEEEKGGCASAPGGPSPAWLLGLLALCCRRRIDG